ncbi:hypothetical protein MUO65_07785 [bacterium]|nr:hypothetical protein [bacterium]
MFDEIRARLKEKYPTLKEKYRKDPRVNGENSLDRFRDFLNNELSSLEKLVEEEAKLKKMAEEKRQEIREVIGRLEGKMSLFKEELEKLRLLTKDLFKNKDIEKEQTLPLEETESGGVGEDGGNEIICQREDWELRLQSKEEENKLLKNRIAELEEQLRIEKEKREQEIEELKQHLEQTSGGQESV